MTPQHPVAVSCYWRFVERNENTRTSKASESQFGGGGGQQVTGGRTERKRQEVENVTKIFLILFGSKILDPRQRGIFLENCDTQ
jgi:hypothetical protein